MSRTPPRSSPRPVHHADRAQVAVTEAEEDACDDWHPVPVEEDGQVRARLHVTEDEDEDEDDAQQREDRHARPRPARLRGTDSLKVTTKVIQAARPLKGRPSQLFDWLRNWVILNHF